MKKWLGLILLLVVLFSVGGYFFYRKNISVSILATNRSANIYFSQNSYLYKLDPLSNAKSISDVAKYQLSSSGQIANLSLSRDKNYIYYDVTLSQDSQINKFYLDANNLETAYSSKTPGLENFNHFREPKISPDNRYLIFISTFNNIDYIFIKDLANNDLTNLTNSIFQGKITDISWSVDSQKIAFVDSTDTNNSIKIIGLDKKIENIYQVKDSSVIENLTFLNNRILFINNANIYSVGVDNKSVNPVTYEVSPKEIISYSVSPNNQTIIYNLKNQKNINLYRVKIDGTDMFQLTDNGNGSQGIFSRDSKLISYFNQNDGIFVTNLNKTALKKIISISGNLNQLITWR